MTLICVSKIEHLLVGSSLVQIKSDELRAQFASPDLTRSKLDALVVKFQDDVAAGTHVAQG